MEKNKESQTQSLAELQQELKSLKALLLSRGPTISSSPTPPLPSIPRPSIPAWQLASAGSPVSNSSETISLSPPGPYPIVGQSGAKGKGPEVEPVEEART